VRRRHTITISCAPSARPRPGAVQTQALQHAQQQLDDPGEGGQQGRAEPSSARREDSGPRRPERKRTRAQLGWCRVVCTYTTCRAQWTTRDLGIGWKRVGRSEPSSRREPHINPDLISKKETTGPSRSAEQVYRARPFQRAHARPSIGPPSWGAEGAAANLTRSRPQVWRASRTRRAAATSRWRTKRIHSARWPAPARKDGAACQVITTAAARLATAPVHQHIGRPHRSAPPAGASQPPGLHESLGRTQGLPG